MLILALRPPSPEAQAATLRGEINGIGDGLWAFYGRDFAELNRLLAAPAAGAGPEAEASRALVFKQADSFSPL